MKRIFFAFSVVLMVFGNAAVWAQGTPTTVEGLVERAMDYFDRGDDDRALADFNQAIRLSPNDVRLYAMRAIVYSHKGDYDQAIADLTQAIRLNPNFAPAYGDRGDQYLDKAIADYEASLRINPNDATVRQKLESVRRMRGR